MAKTNESSTKFQNFALLGTHLLDLTIYHFTTTRVERSNKLRGVGAYAMHRVPWTKAQIRLTRPTQPSRCIYRSGVFGVSPVPHLVYGHPTLKATVL